MATEDKDLAPAQEICSATVLRDRTWQLINLAHLDYAPKFIGVFSEDQPPEEDGLIRTTMGYYRLAEDMRDGTRVLLHSYSRDQLTGKKTGSDILISRPEESSQDNHNDSGNNSASTKTNLSSHDIYGISARKGVRGAIFRDDIHHDIRFMERRIQKDLNLHVEEVTGADGRRIIKLGNQKVAFGLFETKDGQWRVRLYNNIRENWDKTGGFVPVHEKAPPGFAGQVFSLGRNVRDFETYDEAFTYIQRYWKTASQQLFKGRTSLADANRLSGFSALKWRASGFLLGFASQQRFWDWAIALPVGLAVGLASTPFTAATGLSIALGVAGTAGWVTLAKTAENILSYIHRMTARGAPDREEQAIAALRPYFERNDILRYLAPDKSNMARSRRKISMEALPHLRLLPHRSSDIMYDDGALSSPYSPREDFERLSSAPYRYFGAMFDSSYHEDGLLAGIYPNGMVTLIQVDKETRATRHYLTYREQFNQVAGTHKENDLRAGLENLPAGHAPAHKITHWQGKSFGYTPLDAPELISDLMAKLGPQARDYRVFGYRLPELFGVATEDADKLPVQAKAAQPVTVWERQAPSAPAPLPAPAQ